MISKKIETIHNNDEFNFIKHNNNRQYYFLIQIKTESFWKLCVHIYIERLLIFSFNFALSFAFMSRKASKPSFFVYCLLNWRLMQIFLIKKNKIQYLNTLNSNDLRICLLSYLLVKLTKNWKPTCFLKVFFYYFKVVFLWRVKPRNFFFFFFWLHIQIFRRRRKRRRREKHNKIYKI